MKSYKKVLILSHNALSNQQNNGKTLEAFFKDWDKNCLAQIYLQPETPDFDFCDNYFRLTDYEVLNNIISRGKVGKTIKSSFDLNNSKSFNPIVTKLYNDRKDTMHRRGLNKLIHSAFVSRVPIFVLAREFIWMLSKWKTLELRKWIQDFSPDVLFFQGSSGIFGYNIALWICNEFNIPMILQLTDDYTIGIYEFSLIEKIYKFFYRGIFKKAISISKKVIVISGEMEAEYKKKYGGNYTILMNSIDRDITRVEPNSLRFLYAGNVSINRWETLLKIGVALDQINQRKSKSLFLDIYTPNLLQNDIKAKFDKVNSINYRGTLNQDELTYEIQNSNILIHVESFNKRMKKITRLSISTKIPEYLASKRFILAVGPSDVASIKYLSENNFAFVINSEDVDIIMSELTPIIENNEFRKEIINKAFQGYLSKHKPEFVRKEIEEVIEYACRS